MTICAEGVTKTDSLLIMITTGRGLREPAYNIRAAMVLVQFHPPQCSALPRHLGLWLRRICFCRTLALPATCTASIF